MARQIKARTLLFAFPKTLQKHLHTPSWEPNETLLCKQNTHRPTAASCLYGTNQNCTHTYTHRHVKLSGSRCPWFSSGIKTENGGGFTVDRMPSLIRCITTRLQSAAGALCNYISGAFNDFFQGVFPHIITPELVFGKLCALYRVTWFVSIRITSRLICRIASFQLWAYTHTCCHMVTEGHWTKMYLNKLTVSVDSLWELLWCVLLRTCCQW